jgi:LuxR family transcriptional regulator, quorum-sensing system regulator BjaR1
MISPRRTKSDDPAKLAALSPRERQVLLLFASGKSAKTIGVLLKISPRTVDVHSASINRKLGAENRMHAVAIAIRAGILAQDG